MADSKIFWAYDATYLKSLVTFGSCVKELVEICSDKGELLTSVRAKLPCLNFQDRLFWLNIGFTHQFVRTLFPWS